MKLSIPNYQPAIVDWNFTRSDSVQYNDLLELTRSRFLQLEKSYRKESDELITLTIAVCIIIFNSSRVVKLLR